ncbi:MAG: hypothetical protein A2138_22955 [Deltaproteobacteria bacterium RBG_16_71_12]|nr:MAG: hypothetical protein A2138_22955 [Deltaproteobacteria bacterium RBG_16_71_12]
MTAKWRIEGYDTFSGEEYDLGGEFPSEAEAERSAQERLKEIEETQPASSSGGQEGIQDRVYVIAPDGSRRRILPR